MHWLDQYGPEVYRWHSFTSDEDGKVSYYRRIGIVEGFFDTDGIDFNGRADCHSLLAIKLSYIPTRDEIVSTWAFFRQQHLLLMAKALPGSRQLRPLDERHRYFCVTPPTTAADALAEASSTITFVDRADSNEDFYYHVLNSNRALDPTKSLSHLFVLPTPSSGDSFKLSFLFVFSHSITEGMTMFAWSAHFTSLFSRCAQRRIATFLSKAPLGSTDRHLHPAQESLYPAVHPGNSARERWAWAITRVLRHISLPGLTPFPNPVLRQPSDEPLPSLTPAYDGVLKYDRLPPVRTRTERVDLSLIQTKRLKDLCRENHVSIGAGVFALIAMTSMRCREIFSQETKPISSPHTTESSAQGLVADPEYMQPPYITGFPLSIRSLLPATNSLPHEGVLLGFSFGHVLPYLSSNSSTFTHRFRVLSRAANHQLSPYQTHSSRHPRRGPPLPQLCTPTHLLRSLYLTTLERAHAKLPETTRLQREKEGWKAPQGELVPRVTITGGATHGISNLGSLGRLRDSLMQNGEIDYYPNSPSPHKNRAEEQDLEKNGEGEKQEKEPEIVDYEWSVRARPGEFLVGVAEQVTGAMMFCVSFDEGMISSERVTTWKYVLGHLLDLE